MAVLQGMVPAPEHAHSLCWSLLDIVEGNASKALLPLLKWAYETNPCSKCRLRTVELLHDLGGLPSDMAQECRFDAVEEIQNLAKGIPVL